MQRRQSTTITHISQTSPVPLIKISTNLTKAQKDILLVADKTCIHLSAYKVKSQISTSNSQTK